MEIGFWRYLYKEHPGLPLKQRIPEVALFRGRTLQDCYFSNQRGLLQKRTGGEVTREAVLDRLHALATKRTDRADLGPDTPVAILRRPASASSNSPPVATVLRAAELTDLLEEPYLPKALPGDFSEEWSLQSIVLPAEDLRAVAVYSRDALGQERIDVVGRSYQAMYQSADGQPAPASSASNAASGALAAVPDAQAMAVEAKALALVQYVQHFHQRSVEGLIAEFVVDVAGRVILHAFWKISFFDASLRPVLPDSMQADGTGKAFLSNSSTSALLRSSQQLGGSAASTTLPSNVSPDAMLAGRSCSTDNLQGTSRPTSATLSRPTSASRERPPSRPGSASIQHAPASASGGAGQGRTCPEGPTAYPEPSGPAASQHPSPADEPVAATPQRPQSPPTPLVVGSPPTTGLRRIASTQDPQDLQIVDDDDVDGADDIDAQIDRLQAARRPLQAQQRHRDRPTHAQRPTKPTYQSGSRSPQSAQVWLLMELWDGGRFLGEAFLPPSGDAPRGGVTAEPKVPEVLELSRPKSVRVDVRKEHGAVSSCPPACRVTVLTARDQKPDSAGSLRLRLLRAELASAGADSSEGPFLDANVPTVSNVRAQLWACLPLADGFECRPLWSSRHAVQVPAAEGGQPEVSVFEWADETIDVAIPAALPPTGAGVKKRPFSARARIGPGDTAAAVPAKTRPSSARSARPSGNRTGSVEQLGPEQRPPRPWSPTSTFPSAPKQPSRPSSAKGPKRPTSARRVSASKPPAGAAKSKPQRPSSAGSQRPSSGKRPSSTQASARARPATAAVRKKQTLHSQQLLSRYQMERDARTRLISILARQLERNRDLLPAWVEQRSALRVVVSRVERQLQKRSGDIDRLLAEREEIEKFYTQKYDTAVRCLSHEQEKAVASVQAKKRELERSLEMEQETTQELLAEEKRNEELRATLDMTVTQLETVQSEMTSFEAESLPRQMADERRDAFMQASPELLHARGRIEDHLKEKEQTYSERSATRAEILKVKGELERQRTHAAMLEDFVRKVTQGNATTGYLLDPTSKKEATGILTSATKLQTTRLQRPSTPPRRTQEAADARLDAFIGRRCAACDEYDVRWPPPAAGVSPGHCPAVS